METTEVLLLSKGPVDDLVKLSLIHLLKELEDPTEEDILEYLSGNLCRCSGFVGQTRSILKFLDYKKGQEEGK